MQRDKKTNKGTNKDTKKETNKDTKKDTKTQEEGYTNNDRGVYLVNFMRILLLERKLKITACQDNEHCKETKYIQLTNLQKNINL